MTDSKWCPGCKISKPTTTEHWYVNRTCSGGFAPKCKECVKLHNARKRTSRAGPRKQRVTRQGRYCPECYGTPEIVRGAKCGTCGLLAAPDRVALVLRKFDHV